MAEKKYFILVLDKGLKTIITFVTGGHSCEAEQRKMLMVKHDITHNESLKRFYFTYPQTIRDLTRLPKKYNHFTEDASYIFI